MMCFGDDRPRRRPNLTPMIDVVFLLLVFFMLVSQFGFDRALPLAIGGGTQAWSGPPRLVDIGPDGSLALNGVPVTAGTLAGALAPLMQSPTDTIVLRTGEGTSLQALVTVMDGLAAAGFGRLVLVD